MSDLFANVASWTTRRWRLTRGIDALAREANRIPWDPRRCSEDERARLSRSVDALLVQVARGRGALDIAIGERLDAMRARGHAARLGFSTVGEYVRERHGESPSSAQKLRRFSRALRERPHLYAPARKSGLALRRAPPGTWDGFAS